MTTARGKVVFWARMFSEYRVPFYQSLYTELRSKGVDLVVLAGKPHAGESRTSILKRLPFARPVLNYPLCGKIYFSRMPHDICNPRLLILEQQNAALHGYWHLIRRNTGLANTRVAWFGHGSDRSLDIQSWKNRWKFYWLKKADWFFAYTKGCADIIAHAGFPRSRITVFNNTVDVDEMRADVLALRQRAQLTSSKRATPTALFCGRLVQSKQIDFLLEACLRIRTQVPGFKLSIIGTGAEAGRVEQFAKNNAWVQWHGAIYGKARAKLFASASIMLHPGLVGLNIVDAFACGLPFVTTLQKAHGPEIEYLQHQINGLITAFDAKAYSFAVSQLLQDHDRLAAIGQAASDSYGRYSMRSMIARFTNGILTSLNN